MNINKESAYLRGLLEGYELDSNKKETKLFTKILELIDEMADHITALEADNAELREYIEELDQDLGEVEEEVFFADDECDGDCDDCDCEDCDGHDAGHAHDEEHCCEDTPLYLRASGSDVHVEKRYLVSNDSFIIPQQPVLPVSDAVADCILLWHLKIPDVRVPYHALRAPPVV